MTDLNDIQIEIKHVDGVNFFKTGVYSLKEFLSILDEIDVNYGFVVSAAYNTIEFSDGGDEIFGAIEYDTIVTGSIADDITTNLINEYWKKGKKKLNIALYL